MINSPMDPLIKCVSINAPDFVPFDPSAPAVDDPQAPHLDSTTLALFHERLEAGLCPYCATCYGAVPSDRLSLLVVDGTPGQWSEPTWVFLGPCGHRVLEIAKGSILARRYGLESSSMSIQHLEK